MKEREGSYIPPESGKSEEKPTTVGSKKKKILAAGLAAGAAIAGGAYLEHQESTNVPVKEQAGERDAASQKQALEALKEMIAEPRTREGKSIEDMQMSDAQIGVWIRDIVGSKDKDVEGILIELSNDDSDYVATRAVSAMLAHEKFMMGEHLKKSLSDNAQPNFLGYDRRVTEALVQLLDRNDYQLMSVEDKDTMPERSTIGSSEARVHTL